MNFQQPHPTNEDLTILEIKMHQFNFHTTRGCGTKLMPGILQTITDGLPPKNVMIIQKYINTVLTDSPTLCRASLPLYISPVSDTVKFSKCAARALRNNFIKQQPFLLITQLAYLYFKKGQDTHCPQEHGGICSFNSILSEEQVINSLEWIVRVFPWDARVLFPPEMPLWNGKSIKHHFLPLMSERAQHRYKYPAFPFRKPTPEDVAKLAEEIKDKKQARQNRLAPTQYFTNKVTNPHLAETVEFLNRRLDKEFYGQNQPKIQPIVCGLDRAKNDTIYAPQLIKIIQDRIYKSIPFQKVLLLELLHELAIRSSKKKFGNQFPVVINSIAEDIVKEVSASNMSIRSKNRLSSITARCRNGSCGICKSLVKTSRRIYTNQYLLTTDHQAYLPTTAQTSRKKYLESKRYYSTN